MAPPPSDASFSSSNTDARRTRDGMSRSFHPDNGSDIPGILHEFIYLDNSESFDIKEKQISVDPISLIEPPPQPPRVIAGLMELPPALLPGKLKFLSHSLPNSAHSSPRFSSALTKKKPKNETQTLASPLQRESNADNEQKPVNPPLEYYLRRSKSCGEGRSFAPSDDFDLWMDGPGFGAQINSKRHFTSFSKPGQRDQKVNHLKKSGNNRRSSNEGVDFSGNDGFKCGALCLFLPGFGKAKAVRPTRKEEAEAENVISRTVSLEKFECGSWASAAIGNCDNSYFDLPMELIRSGSNDANSPVSAAFLFDKDIKGVLKTKPNAARKSHESGRHVRFSTASPTSYPASPATCITPRLRKAREDFNAFLEAQSV